eukprot:1158438-Pelagomonas_calceolata.AAC.4
MHYGSLSNIVTLQEELLAFVHQYGLCLDAINMATCIYRLARMFCSIPAAGQRAQWHQELLASPAFYLLLGRCSCPLFAFKEKQN